MVIFETTLEITGSGLPHQGAIHICGLDSSRLDRQSALLLHSSAWNKTCPNPVTGCPSLGKLREYTAQAVRHLTPKTSKRWGAWVAQSIKRPTSARSLSCGPWVRAPRQALGWWLRAWSLFPIRVSLSLCPSPVHALSLSVPKINKNIEKKLKKNKLDVVQLILWLFIEKKHDMKSN